MKFIKIIFFVSLCVCSLKVNAQSDVQKKISISLIGNTKTKSYIILREIGFAACDSLSYNEIQNLVEESVANLNRLRLFNFIDVETIETQDEIIVKYNLQERWYYWGYPILEHSERNLSTFINYRDLSRINYGAAFDWFNFRGKNEVLRFKTRLGYKEHYALSYHKPGFGKRRIDGILVFADFFRQKKLISEIFKNQARFRHSDNEYLRNILDVGLGYSYRPKIKYAFEIGVKFRQYIYNQEFYSYDLSGITHPRYLMPKIAFNYDSRNSIVYPVSGFYANLRLTSSLYEQNEFSKNINLNLLLQQNTSFGKTKLSLRNELFAGKFFYDNNKLVLFDEFFNFYGDFFMRGYEFYYFPSDFIVSSKNTLSYKLFDFRLNVLPSLLPNEFSKVFSVVYIEAFVDIAHSNLLHNNIYIVQDMFGDSFVYSTGIGLSIETYYDRLIQFRVAYNTCFNKIGIFAEFKTPLYKKF
ncbi:MAG: BamA/TamA family outer membrane protein [Bacteroidales bacterium]|nr:BamA/TamA family outer membrane protein [Bacteroidales bacterium]